MPEDAAREEIIRAILRRHFGENVNVLRIEALTASAIKAVSHSLVYRVCFTGQDPGKEISVILKFPRRMANGDHHISNRLRTALWQYEAFNRLPGHARAFCVGTVDAGGMVLTLNEIRDVFILEEDLRGQTLMSCLERFQKTGQDVKAIRQKVYDAARYLSSIHARCPADTTEYARVVREYSARYFRLIDEFPADDPFVTRYGLRLLKFAVDWHWKLKPHRERLCTIHGDFHPGNILFLEDSIKVIDRKHIEWGDPNEDVAAFAVNLVYFSLLRSGRLEPPFTEFLKIFFEEYLSAGLNRDYSSWLPPFLMTRLLVLINSAWYPRNDENTKRQLIRCIEVLLAAESLSWEGLIAAFK